MAAEQGIAAGDRTAAVVGAIADNVARVINGKDDVVLLALICLLAEGHLLVEDVPGVGKTTLAKALATSIDGSTVSVPIFSAIIWSIVCAISAPVAFWSGFTAESQVAGTIVCTEPCGALFSRLPNDVTTCL